MAVLVDVGAGHDVAVGRENGVGLVERHHVAVHHQEKPRAVFGEPTAGLLVAGQIDARREAGVTNRCAELGQSPSAILPFSYAA